MSYLGQVLPDVTQNYQKRQRKRVIVSLPNNELGLLTKLQKKKNSDSHTTHTSTSLQTFVEKDEHVNMLWG